MSDYLIHFNKNHNPKTGRFDYGDGDGDGINNDHANARRESKSLSATISRAVSNMQDRNYERKMIREQQKYEKQRIRKGALRTGAVTAAVLGMPLTAINLGVSSVGTSARGRKFVRQVTTGRFVSAATTLGKSAIEEYYLHPDTVNTVNDWLYTVGG